MLIVYFSYNSNPPQKRPNQVHNILKRTPLIKFLSTGLEIYVVRRTIKPYILGCLLKFLVVLTKRSSLKKSVVDIDAMIAAVREISFHTDHLSLNVLLMFTDPM